MKFVSSLLRGWAYAILAMPLITITPLIVVLTLVALASLLYGGSDYSFGFAILGVVLFFAYLSVPIGGVVAMTIIALLCQTRVLRSADTKVKHILATVVTLGVAYSDLALRGNRNLNILEEMGMVNFVWISLGVGIAGWIGAYVVCNDQ